jgi:hypothetical protein
MAMGAVIHGLAPWPSEMELIPQMTKAKKITRIVASPLATQQSPPPT